MDIHFAPLQGYTDHAYRSIHARMAGGVMTYYTPFIRWEKGGVRSKDVRDMLPENNHGLHLIPQIICGTVEDLQRLSDLVQEHGYTEMDINMGCPAPMQTKLHRGSGILPEAERVAMLFEEVARRTDVSYSLKMRLGFEDKTEWRALMPLINESCVTHVTVHPRIGKQMYKGVVDREEFALLAKECRKPLIYNGDLMTLSDIREVERDFPQLKAVMLGRGLLARPTLAAEYADGGEWDERRRWNVVRQMHDAFLDFCRQKYVSDSQVLLQVRVFWEYQQPWMDKKQYKRIMKAGSMRNYIEAVKGL